MGEFTKIEWAHHTFNPWIGCAKVSPGCQFCYAEREDNRRHWTPDGWGPGKPRKRTSAANWRKPLAWNAKAERLGIRYRVFCASLADWLDEEAPHEWREDLLNLILKTPHLDWLLLSKRVENLPRFFGKSLWMQFHLHFPNVWLGTSVEDQARLEERVPRLLAVPATVHFLSAEPLLGPLDFHQIEEEGDGYGDSAIHYNMLSGERWMRDGFEKEQQGELPIDWVIVGGESGPKARPLHPEWVTGIRDQCQTSNTAFFFKQWGEWHPVIGVPQSRTQEEDGDIGVRLSGQVDPVVGPRAVHAFPDGQEVERIGKPAAGRLLDGREWNELPAAAHEHNSKTTEEYDD